MDVVAYRKVLSVVTAVRCHQFFTSLKDSLSHVDGTRPSRNQKKNNQVDRKGARIHRAPTLPTMVGEAWIQTERLCIGEWKVWS